MEQPRNPSLETVRVTPQWAVPLCHPEGGTDLSRSVDLDSRAASVRVLNVFRMDNCRGTFSFFFKRVADHCCPAIAASTLLKEGCSLGQVVQTLQNPTSHFIPLSQVPVHCSKQLQLPCAFTCYLQLVYVHSRGCICHTTLLMA